MNILVFNHYQTSWKYSSSSRYSALAAEWAAGGHQVMVVSASYSHLYNTRPAFSGLWREESVDGVRYLLLKTPAYKDNGLGRTLNLAVFVLIAFLMIPYFVLALRPHVVLATSVYLLDTIPAWIIARLSRATLVREVRDIWPLSLFELGALRPGSAKARILGWLERFSLRRADHVVSTLPFAYDHLGTLGLPPDRFTYIPLASSKVDPLPVPEELPGEYLSAIQEMRGRFPCLVGFAGSIGHGDSLDVLIPAAARLKGTGIGFVLVGDGIKRQIYQDQVVELGLDNILFLPRTNRRNCMALFSLMDGLYIGWESQPLYRFGISPNRMLDYMQSRRPIVHAITYGNDPVAEAGCGFTVPSGDVEALAAAFRKLADTPPEVREAFGRAAVRYVEERHAPAPLAERFLACMNK